MIRAFLIFFCLLLHLNVVAFETQEQTFLIEPDLSTRADLSVFTSTFSKEEINWIKAHPVIRVGGESDWPPFDFVDSNTQYNGISRVFLQIIANQTNLRFRVEIDQWDVLLDKIKNRQIDLLPVVYYSKDRNSYINFTAQPYQKIVDYIFIRDDSFLRTADGSSLRTADGSSLRTADGSNIKKLSDLNDKTVAIPKGYANIERIKTVFPGIKVIEVASPDEAINAVITYQADMLYESLTTMSYLLKTNGITTIKPFSTLEGFAPTPLYMGTRKDWDILAQIINKVLVSIPQEEKNRILSI